jgi:hypothetical protein
MTDASMAVHLCPPQTDGICNAAVTANNILASQRFFRLGIVSELSCAAEFDFLLWVLYRLLGAVNDTPALLHGDPGSAPNSHYVRECTELDCCPGALRGSRQPSERSVFPKQFDTQQTQPFLAVAQAFEQGDIRNVGPIR